MLGMAKNSRPPGAAGWKNGVIAVLFHRKLPVSALALCLLACLSACAVLPDPENTQDLSSDLVAVVSPGHSAGQTFVARRPRFTGITLWFGEQNTGAPLTVELFSDPPGEQPLYVATIGAGQGEATIEIPDQPNQPNQPYYLRLSASQGEVQLMGRKEDVFAQGSAYVDDQPIEADLAFRVSYQYDAAALWADLRGAPGHWQLIAPLALTLLLPGWFLLDLSGLKSRFDGGERLALSLGLSLAVIPVAMLWSSFIGLRWSSGMVWLTMGVLLAVLIWRWFRQRPRFSAQPPGKPNPPIAAERPPARFQPAFWLLLAIFSLALITRFAMVRDLSFPAWVDPVHHGLITRLILAEGALPASFEPYLPPEAADYHFGYHSVLAVFLWLSGLELSAGMQTLGQVLNAAIVLALYLFAHTLTRQRASALFAALIPGFFTLMPAYYAGWGRYTQLTGLLVLPVGLALAAQFQRERMAEQKEAAPLAIALAGLTFAGLFLIHYRVAAFLGLLLLVYLFVQTRWQNWPRHLGRLALAGLAAALLLLPWLIPTIRDFFAPKAQAWTGVGGGFSPIAWYFLEPVFGREVILLAVAGLLLSILQRQRYGFTVSLWVGLLYLAANMGVWRLPGSGFITSLTVDISLFMPLAVLAGDVCGQAVNALALLPGRWRTLSYALAVILAGAAAVIGAQRLLPTLNPVTFLARQSDRAAIDWIGQNIPPGETILINPTGWGYGLYIGNDGGYWIAPLTGRKTMPPPALYGLGEHAEIDQFIGAILPLGQDAAALWEQMRLAEIRYVYLGARGGILSAQALADSENFILRYHADGNWVFEARAAPP